MNYCKKCGAAHLLDDSFCAKCGSPLFVQKAKSIDRNFRKHFALTFILALLTGFFWFMQRYSDNSTMSIFAPLSSMLSLVARFSFLVAFLARSKNWLAVSAIASTTSLLLGVVGSIPFGFYDTDWAIQLTWLFSLSTLIAYFLQARSYGIRPFGLSRL
jgi:hypothetical protein